MSRQCSQCEKPITDWAERVGADRPDLCFACYGAWLRAQSSTAANKGIPR